MVLQHRSVRKSLHKHVMNRIVKCQSRDFPTELCIISCFSTFIDPYFILKFIKFQYILQLACLVFLVMMAL